MKIKDFIQEYTDAQNKEKYLRKHITTDYIDWGVKVLEAERIVQISCYQGDDKQFRMNSPLRYYLYILAVVRNYTDLEIEENQGIQSFDLLERNGLTTALLEAIGVDAQSFQTVLNMTLDDHIANYRDLTSWLEGKKAGLMALFDALGDVQTEE